MAAQPNGSAENSRSPRNLPGPAWASALGVIVIIMGVLLTATHSNEWMKHSVLSRAAPSGEVPSADCPEDELEEEGITMAECEYMVSRLQGLIVSTPEWFPGLLSALSSVGALVAFATIFVGSGLVSFRAWAPRAGVFALSVLLLVDIGIFVAALNAGPIIRDIYLWDVLLWLTIHLILVTAFVVGVRTMRSADVSCRPESAG